MKSFTDFLKLKEAVVGAAGVSGKDLGAQADHILKWHGASSPEQPESEPTADKFHFGGAGSETPSRGQRAQVAKNALNSLAGDPARAVHQLTDPDVQEKLSQLIRTDPEAAQAFDVFMQKLQHTANNPDYQ